MDPAKDRASRDAEKVHLMLKENQSGRQLKRQIHRAFQQVTPSWLPPVGPLLKCPILPSSHLRLPAFSRLPCVSLTTILAKPPLADCSSNILKSHDRLPFEKAFAWAPWENVLQGGGWIDMISLIVSFYLWGIIYERWRANCNEWWLTTAKVINQGQWKKRRFWSNLLN